MTSYAAYDAGLPCQNPSCKSHGKPHPNCRCYTNVASSEHGKGMAKGGEVEHYCAANRAHHRLCEYYAEGGSVGLFDVPQHVDPALSVASYLGHSGLHGLLDIGAKDDDQSIHKYNQSIKKGHKKLSSKVDRLFKNGPSEAIDTTKAKKTVEDWLEKGGINHDIQQEVYKQNAPQQLALGGKVDKPEGIAHDRQLANAYPEQNMILQSAKGRLSNYLSSLKPQKNAPRLAFDDEPDHRDQDKSYKRALDIAVDPLSILDKIRSGKIESEHIKHFKSMYPEIDQVLHGKIAEGISKAQLAQEKPDFHVRQGLSMLLGTPMSGELSHQNMIAAQAVFQPKQPSQGQDQSTKPKTKTSSIEKASQSYLLPSQAAAGRQQKQ